jgi:hypothetical protein
MHWLLLGTKDLTVGLQLLIEAIKALLALMAALLITRWTLARADRKDIINRQAATLDRYSTRRIQSLDEANSALGKIRLHVTLLTSFSEGQRGTTDVGVDELTVDKVNAARENIDTEIDGLLLACEAYGQVPGSVPCELLDVGEAIIVWTEPFYSLIDSGMINAQRYHEAYEMCSDLQVQLRWLKMYELSMQLEANKSPGTAWSNDHMPILETSPLPFLFNSEKATKIDKG